jgi:Domain of unknown function (DUF4342)
MSMLNELNEQLEQVHEELTSGAPTAESVVESVLESVAPVEVVTEASTEASPETNTAANVETIIEEFRISGDTLVTRVKELLHQGNIRRITIKNEDGQTLIEIPLTVGVVGGVISAAFFPVIAAVGVIGAMVAHLTISIERRE